MDVNMVWIHGILILSVVMAALGRVVDSSLDRLSPCVTGDCSHSQNMEGDTGLLSQLLPRSKRQTVIVVGEGPTHRLQCTKREIQQAACLHGKCYALNLGENIRTANCHCPAKYEGPRCERLSVYYFMMYQAEMTKLAIIGSVVLILIIVIVGISVYCSYRKGKLKRRQEAERSKNVNGSKNASDNATSEEKENLMENGKNSSPHGNHLNQGNGETKLETVT